MRTWLWSSDDVDFTSFGKRTLEGYFGRRSDLGGFYCHDGYWILFGRFQLGYYTFAYSR